MAAIFGTVVVAFWPTVAALSTRYDSYRHVGVVFTAFAVIVWQLRWELSILPVRPFWPGLAVVICAGVVWLAGELLFARILTDIGVIAMLSATILTIFGYRWLWSLTFPLTFLLFAIPIGGPLVPTLVDWTAKIAVMWLNASGVPIHREGAYFNIPTGSWSIAEACSGIGYFINCLMLGCLYAWVLYRSTLKRVVFITGACIIGIAGNWIRVYLTVIIAHLSDNRFLRDDHSAFGWIVFAVLLLGYCCLGLIFRDAESKLLPIRNADFRTNQIESQSTESSSKPQIFAAVAAVLAILIVWPLARNALKQHQEVRIIDIANINPEKGWRRTDNFYLGWVPELQNPSKVRIQTFEKAGHRIGVFIGIFQNQTWTSKLVTSTNQLASVDNPDWKLLSRGVAHTKLSGKPLAVDTGVIQGRDVQIVAWRWYWVEGVATANDPAAKAQQLLARLNGQKDVSAWIAIYSETKPSFEFAANTLEVFMRDMGASLQKALVATMQD